MTHVTKTFQSITQMPPFIEAHPDLYGNAKKAAGSFSSPSRYWDDGVGMDGAMDMARQGGFWQEGANKMREVVSGMADLKSRAKIDMLENDVAGFMPDIDAYIAGQPDNMLNLEEGDELENPVIIMGVHVGRASSVTQKQAVNRGAAILSLIDDLEHKGLRVELWAIWRNQDSGDSADFRVKLKDAEGTWSPHSVAFALCHGAMNRRLMFAVAEGTPGIPKLIDSMGWGMPKKPEDMDIWFPRVDHEDRGDWGTMEKAIANVTQIFQEQTEPKE